MRVDGTWSLSVEDEEGEVDTRATFRLSDGVIADAETGASLGNYRVDTYEVHLILMGTSNDVREIIVGHTVTFGGVEEPQVLSAVILPGEGAASAEVGRAMLHRLSDEPFNAEQIGEDVRFDDSDFPW